MVRRVLADDWGAFPVWARNLSYRLACLLRPDDAELHREAAADLRFVGPAWDGVAQSWWPEQTLSTPSLRLRRNREQRAATDRPWEISTTGRLLLQVRTVSEVAQLINALEEVVAALET